MKVDGYWNNFRINSTTHSDHTFMFCKKWTHKYFIENDNLRKGECMYYQLYLSHNFTKTSKHLDSNNISDDKCRICGLYPETVTHIIKTCTHSFYKILKLKMNNAVDYVLLNYKKQIEKFLLKKFS